VPTDEPYESDEEFLEYERESVLFEMWKKDQLVQVKHEMKALERKKARLEYRQFPDMDDWLRNKQFSRRRRRGEKSTVMRLSPVPKWPIKYWRER
jgi:hypothetical protein